MTAPPAGTFDSYQGFCHPVSFVQVAPVALSSTFVIFFTGDWYPQSTPIHPAPNDGDFSGSIALLNSTNFWMLVPGCVLWFFPFFRFFVTFLSFIRFSVIDTRDSSERFFSFGNPHILARPPTLNSLQAESSTPANRTRSS
jgi:hypothetical protein